MSGAAIATLLDRAVAGQRLYFDDALRLYHEADLAALGQAADTVRQRQVPGAVVTYAVERAVLYTNVCEMSCQHCQFRRPPGHADAFVVTRDALVRGIDELLARGGTRLLMQGGHNPGLTFDWYLDLLHWLRQRYPTIELDCFSPGAIVHLAQHNKLSIRVVLQQLQAAGLQGLPGDGADMLDAESNCGSGPVVLTTDTWLTVMREAQKLGLHTSARLVIAPDGSYEQQVRHLQRLRDLQDYSQRTHGNGFYAFASWALPTAAANIPTPAATNDYLRHAAIARLFLDNVPHHQAIWSAHNPALSQHALAFGLDDLGATGVEDHVLGPDSQALAAAVREHDIHTLIRNAGFVPARRDSLYNVLHIFDDTADQLSLSLPATAGDYSGLHARLN